MAQDAGPPNDGVEAMRVAALWRRAIAFLLDGVIIGLPLMGIGLLFFDAAASLGELGRLVGLGVGAVYFAIFDSSVGGGQSLGKRLLRIKVVRTDGRPLSPASAGLRALIVLTPFNLNGISLEVSSLWIAIVAGLVFGLALSMIYLFLFESSRRSLHDLVTGAMVINARAAPLPVLRPLWKGHWVATGFLCSAIVALAGTGWFLAQRENPLQAVRRAVDGVPGVRSTKISFQSFRMFTLRSGASERNRVVVVAMLDQAPTAPVDLAWQVEDAIFSKPPDAFGQGEVLIVLRHGFTLGGFASAYSNFTMPTSLSQWRVRTKQTTL